MDQKKNFLQGELFLFKWNIFPKNAEDCRNKKACSSRRQPADKNPGEIHSPPRATPTGTPPLSDTPFLQRSSVVATCACVCECVCLERETVAML
jgi:hypothetical protein